MGDDIDALVQRLRNEARVQSVNRSGTWRRYDDSLAAMSAEQKSWVCKQESVMKAKSEMYTQFIDYLFELNKEAFVSVGDGNYRKVCEDYVDSIQKSASSYVSRSDILEKQNEDLVKRNEELQRKLNEILGGLGESVATSGSGYSRESNSNGDIRTGNNPRPNCDDPQLFSAESE